MSHFYIGSSDCTNGGNRQKYSVMAYGTSAAICASFHWNWHHSSWWSVVTAKNTARAVQRERDEEGEGRGGGASFPQTSALMSSCISNSTIKSELASVRGEKIWARGETSGESYFTHPPFQCLDRSGCLFIQLRCEVEEKLRGKHCFGIQSMTFVIVCSPTLLLLLVIICMRWQNHMAWTNYFFLWL